MRANYSSWSAKHQTETDESDNELWDKTEAKHPAVHWWWNQRTVNFKHGAYCYLCDKMIATWDSKFPMTAAAQRAIMEHRQMHINNLRGGKDNNGK